MPRIPTGASRRQVLGGGAGAALTIGVTGNGGKMSRNPSRISPLDPEATALAGRSTFFATAFTEYYGALATASDGDLWPSCWAITGTPEARISGERLFDVTWGDGIRIIGVPGGTSTVTSIAELGAC